MRIEHRTDLRELLAKSKVIAVVGYSDKPYRTSYRIGQYLRNAGYKVYPVNPTISEIDGQPCYPNLSAVPEPIDIVDVFSRSEYLLQIVNEAIAVGAKAIWTQLGVVDEAAAQKADQAGLNVVMDHCIMVDHEALVV